jgi:hypothetical protein
VPVLCSEKESGALALDIYATLRDLHDLSSWLDIKREDKSEAAVEACLRAFSRLRARICRERVRVREVVMEVGADGVLTRCSPRYIDARCRMRPSACAHSGTRAHAHRMDGQAGVRGSDKFMLVMSEEYFERDFCLKELRWAQQYNKEVRIEGTNSANKGTIDPKEGTNNPNKGTNTAKKRRKGAAPGAARPGGGAHSIAAHYAVAHAYIHKQIFYGVRDYTDTKQLTSAGYTVRQVVVAIPPALKPRIGELLKKCPDDLWCVAARNAKRATCSAQQAACNVQRATGRMQRATGRMQRATRNRPHATRNRPHATCNAHKAACNVQRVTGRMQRATCNRLHATCNMQRAMRVCCAAAARRMGY